MSQQTRSRHDDCKSDDCMKMPQKSKQFDLNHIKSIDVSRCPNTTTCKKLSTTTIPQQYPITNADALRCCRKVLHHVVPDVKQSPLHYSSMCQIQNCLLCDTKPEDWN